MLEKEFKYYLENQKDLLKKFNGKFIVIIGEQVFGPYDTKVAAYNETIKTHALGTFLIQQVSPGDQAYTQTFHSRVIINSVAK